MDIKIPTTMDEWNAAGADYLPGLIGIRFDVIEETRVLGFIEVEGKHNSWNGFLHAGTVVSLADTCCGYGTVKALPEGCSGFTTVELKSNFLGTAREGRVECEATPVHKGRTTQIWDAIVRAESSDKPIALFRCTQMILWPRA